MEVNNIYPPAAIWPVGESQPTHNQNRNPEMPLRQDESEIKSRAVQSVEPGKGTVFDKMA